MLTQKLSLIVALILAVPVATLAASYLLAPGLYEDELSSPVSHRDAEWTTSATCRSCHPDHFASWRATFHSTMTQLATPQTVQGRFDGEVVTYWGLPARPVREGDRFFIENLHARTGKVVQRLEVVLTVGSRRYQQYVVKAPKGARGENLYRVPLLWHIGEQRWIHLNGAFLDPDDRAYDNHVTIWNQNCIFCHNTGPQPGSINWQELIDRANRGEAVNSAVEGLYVSEVAELGIACESCHAPGGEHAARNRNPLRRYLLHATGRDDPSIVNPALLSQQRSVEVCGQCHGQRLPDPPSTIREWMHTGPIYRAGETLTDSVSPVSIDTPGPPHQPDMFSRRFWRDGTPRLTAYEYQGITMSPCYTRGEMTCLSCHNMHGGDVRGQIDPEMRTNAACAECHAELVAEVEQHSHHDAGSSGSVCYDCHMPEAMYGVLEIHRSHRIDNPDPARDALNARPDACTNCHLDKTVAWAAGWTRTWWGGENDVEPAPPLRRGDGAPAELLANEAALFAGDPVQRAVAARLAGRDDTPLSPQQRAWLWPVLLQGMKDGYPTIRYFSRLSLQEIDRAVPVPGAAEILEEYDYIAAGPRRARWTSALDELWAALPKDDLPPPPPGSLVGADYQLEQVRVRPLLALQSTKEISIGE